MFVNAITLTILAAAGAVQAVPSAQVGSTMLSSVKAAADVPPTGDIGYPCDRDWWNCKDNLVCQLGVCADPANKKTPPVDPPSGDKWQDQVVAVHNRVRADHGAEALRWADSLASKAQYMVDNCLGPESRKDFDPYGYNGFRGTPWREGDNLGNKNSAVSAVESWYSNIRNYNWNYPGWQQAAGTATQVIWKETQYVGCAVNVAPAGRTSCSGYQYYFICLYSPTGNVNSREEFQKNVRPKRTGGAEGQP